MKRFHLACLLTAILSLPLFLTACSDDDPVEPEGFQVVVVVTDNAGNPIAGVNLDLAPDTAFYQDGKCAKETAAFIPGLRAYPNPFNPTIKFEYVTGENVFMQLWVEDIEGTRIRTLKDEMSTGLNGSILWDGTDSHGTGMASGIYSVHLALRDSPDTEVLFEQSRDILMALLDPQGSSVATTDDNGRIVLKDKRLFPYLYGPDPIEAIDENAEGVGVINLTAAMRFYLYDPAQDRTWRFDHDVTGSTALQFKIDTARN